MPEESDDGILRTHQEFSQATKTSMLYVNESHAVWMDRVFGKALDAVVSRLAAVQEIVHAAGDDPDWERMALHLRDVVWISHEAVNGTMAAYQLVRHGYWQEALVLVRHVTEIVAVTLHLCIEPGIRDEFVSGKWRSTKSIGPAARIIPGLGRTYGHLSDHAHPMHEFLVGKSSVSEERADERLTYSIGGGMQMEKEFFFRHAIRDILGAGMILHAAMEFAFRHKVTEFHFWRVEGERLEWQPTAEENGNLRAMDELGRADGNVVPSARYGDFQGLLEGYAKGRELLDQAMEEVRRRRESSAP